MFCCCCLEGWVCTRPEEAWPSAPTVPTSSTSHTSVYFYQREPQLCLVLLLFRRCREALRQFQLCHSNTNCICWRCPACTWKWGHFRSGAQQLRLTLGSIHDKLVSRSTK
eukprot:TRINITY_DN2514_c0_g1_i3.p4 TRINITY_DN2514_c0_g1~~TRINITY_DN2514_c0_g1_i3.p4  ORF type:complete len:110 (+),score=6.57 TRINITY_DN2514_c0_g1_i3:1192-1521(+)